MEIVFIRHAEKEDGMIDPSITEKGVLQAENLSRKLEKDHFDEFYCSNMRRAIQTANKVSHLIKINPIIEESLKEFDLSIFKKSQAELSDDLVQHYKSLKKFLEKFTKEADKDKKILIIAHGNTNRIILSILLELDLKNLIRFRQSETAINEVYWAEKFNNWRLKYWNDVSHQPEELITGKNKY